MPFGIMAVVASVDIITGPAIGLLPTPRPWPRPASALAAVRHDLIEHVEGASHDDAAMLLLRYREN